MNIKGNLFWKLREYCLSHRSCEDCIFCDDDGNCGTEDIDKWSDIEIREFSRFLAGWEKECD